MEDSYVQIMKCRFCGDRTNSLALNKRMKPMKDEVYDPEPCDNCKRLFDEGMRFFVGDCNHSGFIKYEPLTKIFTEKGLQQLGTSPVFRMEKCFACMGYIKLEDCGVLGGETP